MSPKHEEILATVKEWLGKQTSINVTDLSKNGNLIIQITQKNLDKIPVFIARSKEYEDILLVGWAWPLTPADTSSFQKLEKGKLNVIMDSLSRSVLQMNLNIRFNPSIEDLRVIECERVLKVDELTKTKLLTALADNVIALKIIGQKMISELALPSRFDPASNV